MNFKGSARWRWIGDKRSGHYCPPLLKDRLLISWLGRLSRVPIKSVNGIDGVAAWSDHWMFSKWENRATTPPCPLLPTASPSSLLPRALRPRFSSADLHLARRFKAPLLSSVDWRVTIYWLYSAGRDGRTDREASRSWRHWSSVM